MLEPIKAALKSSGKGVWMLMLAGLTGILLIAVSDIAPKSTGTAQPDTTAEDYCLQMEQRLQNMIQLVDGAGKATVMITLESSEEKVYAVDTGAGQDSTEHIIMDTTQGDDALVNLTWMPTVQGVAIICEGGSDPAVCSTIRQMACVLLGVSENRVSIAKMTE